MVVNFLLWKEPGGSEPAAAGDTMRTHVPLFLGEAALHTAGTPKVMWCLPEAPAAMDWLARTGGNRDPPLHPPLLDPTPHASW